MASNHALDEPLDTSAIIQNPCAPILEPGASPLQELEDKEKVLKKWLAEDREDEMKLEDLQRGATDPTITKLLGEQLDRCRSSILNLNIILYGRKLGETRRQALIDFVTHAIEAEGGAGRINKGWIQVIKENPKAGAEAWAACHLHVKGRGMRPQDLEAVYTLRSSFDPESESISRAEVLKASGFSLTDNLELLREEAAEALSQYSDSEACAKSYLKDLESGKTSSDDAFSKCTPQ